jgi:hypothetical protein
MRLRVKARERGGAPGRVLQHHVSVPRGKCVALLLQRDANGVCRSARAASAPRQPALAGRLPGRDTHGLRHAFPTPQAIIDARGGRPQAIVDASAATVVATVLLAAHTVV